MFFCFDDVVDVLCEDFVDNINKLGEIIGLNIIIWIGYLEVICQCCVFFCDYGVIVIDYGYFIVLIVDLLVFECEVLFVKCLIGKFSVVEQELFCGQMLIELVGMSIEDGMVM